MATLKLLLRFSISFKCAYNSFCFLRHAEEREAKKYSKLNRVVYETYIGLSQLPLGFQFVSASFVESQKCGRPDCAGSVISEIVLPYLLMNCFTHMISN